MSRVVERGGPAGEILKVLGFCAFLLASVAVVYLTPVRGWLEPANEGGVRGFVEQQGAWAPVTFLLLNAASVAVGAPRLLFAAVAGVLFGFALGTLLAQLSTMIGCIATFELARRLGRGFVERKVGVNSRRLRPFLDRLGEHGIAGNVVIRTVPIGNCLAVNLLMAVSPIPRRDFVIGTFLGILPETAVYALLGSGARDHLALRVTVSCALLLALALVYVYWTRRSRLGRELLAARALEAAPPAPLQQAGQER